MHKGLPLHSVGVQSSLARLPAGSSITASHGKPKTAFSVTQDPAKSTSKLKSLVLDVAPQRPPIAVAYTINSLSSKPAISKAMTDKLANFGEELRDLVDQVDEVFRLCRVLTEHCDDLKAKNAKLEQENHTRNPKSRNW